MKRYEIAEYVMKTREALARLRETQRPGEQGGAGTKTDVLRAVRDELGGLLNDGYTVQQIAEALRGDVFGILPKTITQIVRESSKACVPKRAATKAGTKRRTSKATETGAGKRADGDTSPSTQQKQTSPQLPVPGTFAIQNDSDDL